MSKEKGCDQMEKDKVKEIVKESYGKIAAKGCGCSCSCNEEDYGKIAESIGYSAEDINAAPDANLGLGCGNPTALGQIEKGMTVLDLGSGAGFDCFLAAKKVGEYGRVIGVDMTKEMIKKSRANARKYGYPNVEFRLGDIEELPVEDGSIDVVISNCVINLAPNKEKVFGEAYRVLKEGGRLFVSDIVLLRELSAKDREDENLIAGCVGGAIMRDEYLSMVRAAGFKVKILGEDKEISKKQYNGFPLESLKIEAYK